MLTNLVLAAVACGAVPGSEGAVTVELRPHRRWVACPAVGKPINVDGKLDEWDVKKAPIRISPETTKRAGRYWPTIDNAADASAVCDWRWDEQYLYLMVRATDDKLCFGVPTRAFQHWNLDSLQINLHPSPRGVGAGRYPTMFPMKSVLVPKPDGVNLDHLPPGSKAAVVRRPDGYDAEVALAWKGLNARARAGDIIKLTLLQVDADSELGATGRADGLWGQMAWLWQPRGGVDTDTKWWADLRLLAPDGTAGDIIVGRNRCRPGEAVAFKTQLDTLSTRRGVRAVEVRNEKGQTVASLPVGRSLEPGKTLVAGGTIPTAKLAPGTYQIVVAFEKGGAVGPQTTLIVAADGATTTDPAVEVDLAVEPDRYGSQGTAARPKKKITKQTYLAFLERTRRKKEASVLEWVPKHPLPKRPQLRDALRAVSQARMPAMWYTVWKDEKYARTTLEHLRLSADAIHALPDTVILGFYYLALATLDYEQIKDSPSLTEADHKWIRKWLLRSARLQSKQVERGPTNHAEGHALGLHLLANWYPDIPEAKVWKSFSDAVWHDHWLGRETGENSSGYNTLSTQLRFRWVKARGDDKRGHYDDPHTKAYYERFLHHLCPIGVMPFFGDGIGWTEHCEYIHIFETLATVYRDGRFKWAAHRVMEHWLEIEPDMMGYHFVADHAVLTLAYAYLVADDSIPEVVPEGVSRVTHRRGVNFILHRWQDERMKSLELADATVPDKIVLKSGTKTGDMMALVGACGPMGHDGYDTAAFHALTDHGTVLLSDQGYLQRDPEYHNLLVVEDLEGLPPVERLVETSVPEFYESPVATFTTLQVRNHTGLPITSRRSIAFVKNHCIVVRDAVTFHESFKCRVYPVWHTRKVGPKVGTTWANTYVDRVVLRDIWKPVVMASWAGKPYDLLVHFAPRPDCRMRVHEPEPGTHVPVRVRYEWVGLPKRGQTLVFTTVLLPHAPGPDPDKLASAIRVLADTGDRFIAKVPRPGRPDAYIVLNGTGAALQAGPIRTDARFACVLVKDGKAAQHSLWKGKTLRFDGKSLKAP